MDGIAASRCASLIAMKMLANAVRKYLAAAAVGLGVAVALIAINEVAVHRAAVVVPMQSQLQELSTSGFRLDLLLKAAESAQRGYLLTGEDSFLGQYQQAAEQAQGEFAAFSIALKALPAVPAKLPELDTAVSTKLSEMAVAVRLRQQGHVDAAQFITSTDVGRVNMAVISEQLAQIRSAQRQLSANNVQQLRSTQDFSRTGLVLAVVTGLLAFLLYLRQSLALHQSIAHANAQLKEDRDRLEVQVRERTEDLRNFATYLQHSRELDRARLAHELHDELGALLTSAKLSLARIKSKTAEQEDLQALIASVSDSLTQVITMKRRIIEDLRPSSLDNFGLVTSLEILAKEFAERSGLEVNADIEDVTLNKDAQLALYRLVQESLTNVAKYANATRVCVNLRVHASHVELSVEDNGMGFDSAKIKPKSHGLAGMRLRVESIGGQLDISTQLGQGTKVFAAVPLDYTVTDSGPPDSSPAALS